MPVVHKPEKTMAMVPVAEPSSSSGTRWRPRRNPTNLQGLLQFAMEATRAEDAPQDPQLQPMDEERRQFLENALKSMTIDVVEELQKQIAVLKKVDEVSADQEVSEYTDAIANILEYVDNIDIANDFHKIGGFMILWPCLHSKNAKIRAGGCELLAVLCQNNPYCQNVVLDNEFLPMLLRLIERDQDETVRTKAIYALAGIVRESEEGFQQLRHYKGLPLLIEVIKKNNSEKCVIKTAFLLENLCTDHPELKGMLVSLGCVPALISVISSGTMSNPELILSLLVSLLNNEQGLQEGKNPAHKLKDIVLKHLDVVRGHEECKEEEEHCKALLKLLDS